jgi:ABC-type transport system involved in multi-copper enzyme maturation permease subunit
MTFLPIVERELRVAARRRSTYYLRMASGMFAVVIGGMAFGLALAMSMAGGPSSLPIGVYAFYALSYYLFLICLLAGVFLAADSLSEERREGTLGFLFLTDLKGYDIVLGKLLAVSLNAFYGLLAVFPVLGISLVIGGITGGEFGRMCLALTNALWFSITAALWVSSHSEASFRATANTVVLLVLLTVIPPVFAAVFPASALVFHLCSISPFEAFHFAQAANYFRLAGNFWSSLAISNLAGWAFLALASWRLPRFVEAGVIGENANVWQRMLAGDLSFGKKHRQSGLLDLNPVLWLLEDSRAVRWMTWALCIAGSVLVIACAAWGKTGVMFIPTFSRPFYFLMKVLFTLQACRFFSEARCTGTLELLCTTPISSKTMIEGQWLALRRLFLWPVLILMSAELLCWLFSLGGFSSQVPPGMFWFTLFFGVPWQVATSIADFFAIGWFGMWLALTAKKPQFAAGLTILFLLILPSVAFCVPTFVIDIIFIVVCMSKLGRDFRVAVAGMDGSGR